VTAQHATNRNDETTSSHTTRTGFRAFLFGVFSLLLDFLLIGFFYFMEYYDYRSFTEFAALDSATTAEMPPPTAPPPSEQPPRDAVATEKTAQSADAERLSSSVIDLARKKIKANIHAFKAKIEKGEGTDASNQKGLEKWEKELQDLERITPKE
jgi:hypothetical protein